MKIFKRLTKKLFKDKPTEKNVSCTCVGEMRHSVKVIGGGNTEDEEPIEVCKKHLFEIVGKGYLVEYL